MLLTTLLGGTDFGARLMPSHTRAPVSVRVLSERDQQRELRRLRRRERIQQRILRAAHLSSSSRSATVRVSLSLPVATPPSEPVVRYESATPKVLPPAAPQHSAVPVPSPVASQHSASSANSSVALHESAFPSFDRAVFPVSRIPNWGAMTTPEEWNRSYAEMSSDDFVGVPSYDLSKLAVPLADLKNPRNVQEITRKLFYSTRYFGAYDIDAGEFTGGHPGLDLKLPIGTPVGSVAGGRVSTVRTNDMLGLHVIIEHRAPSGETFYSIYAHLGSASVRVGQDVSPGTTVGTVGMTGNTSGAHLHWQIDRGEPGEANHGVYATLGVPSRAEADREVISPITFLRQFGN